MGTPRRSMTIYWTMTRTLTCSRSSCKSANAHEVWDLTE
jgi:hypothetical protein